VPLKILRFEALTIIAKMSLPSLSFVALLEVNDLCAVVSLELGNSVGPANVSPITHCSSA
jgi:hypothetical protein